jgi:chemotaxis response regulator CheB
VEASAAPAQSQQPAVDPFAGLSLELEPVASSDDGVDDNPFANLDFDLDAEAAPAVTAPASAQKAVAAPAPSGHQSYAQAAPAMSGGFTHVWVLGASIGGPDAVREFLSGIPKSTRNVFLLAQHMGADFLDLMVSQLAKVTALEVKMAAAGVAAHAGQVLVVPLAERMLLSADGDVRIVPLDEASPYSPSIDQVLFDVADRFGARAGAIIFSGMAHDAIEGAKHLAAKGGVVWVQDPATCVVSSMIDGAIEAGIVRYQGSPAELARKFAAEFA